jgi:hypothetical protein
LGIFLNMIGVVLIFFYGISPLLKMGKDGSQIFFLNEEEQKSSPKQKIRKTYKKMSNAGIISCIIGSILQLMIFII